MTKVQLEYDLPRPIDDNMMEQIARAHSVYGIFRVSVAPSLDRLVVEYDASRLSAADVENVLQSAGIPVVLKV